MPNLPHAPAASYVFRMSKLPPRPAAKKPPATGRKLTFDIRSVPEKPAPSRSIDADTPRAESVVSRLSTEHRRALATIAEGNNVAGAFILIQAHQTARANPLQEGALDAMLHQDQAGRVLVLRVARAGGAVSAASVVSASAALAVSTSVALAVSASPADATSVLVVTPDTGAPVTAWRPEPSWAAR